MRNIAIHFEEGVFTYDIENIPLSSHRMVISPWISENKNKQTLANTDKNINTINRKMFWEIDFTLLIHKREI